MSFLRRESVRADKARINANRAATRKQTMRALMERLEERKLLSFTFTYGG